VSALSFSGRRSVTTATSCRTATSRWPDSSPQAGTVTRVIAARAGPACQEPGWSATTFEDAGDRPASRVAWTAWSTMRAYTMVPGTIG
jgi:hypothetical protein